MASRGTQSRNYWQLLAAAREALAARDFVRAERRWDEAMDSRGTSPGRVFVTEKLGDGLARLMRRGGGEGGRWDRQARSFREDFLAAGEVQVREAVRLADLRPEDNAETNQPILTAGLHLVANSRIFPEEPDSAVILMKGLVRTAHRTGSPFPVHLLRHDLPFSADDRLWLVRKCETMLEGFLSQGHLKAGAPRSHEWSEAVMRLLRADRFREGDRLDEERAWLEARTSDRLLGRAADSLDRYAEYLSLRPEPSPRSDEARLRLLEMRANIDARHFGVPGYEEALRSLQSAGLSPGSEVVGRYRTAMARIEYRRPEEGSAQDSPAWSTVALTSAGEVAVVFWWGAAPRDVALWKPGDDPTVLTAFLEPCDGRVLAADAGAVAALESVLPEGPGAWTAADFAAVLVPEAPTTAAGTVDLEVLGAAESGAWRADWREDLGLPELAPREEVVTTSWGPALSAGLALLALRTRVAGSDPSLRAGVGEMARRGDPVCGFLYPLLVHRDPAGRAVDQGFAPWTLPLLWTRPAPSGRVPSREPAADAGVRPDLARNDLAIVTTGRPGPVIAAWCGQQHRWRIVLDRLDRLEDLLPVAAAAGGPVTVVPPGGAVHDLEAALELLEDLLPGGGRAADAGLLPLCHWRALVTTHNGDLLEGVTGGADPGGYRSRYATLVAAVPRVMPGNGEAAEGSAWVDQFSQRVRRAGCVLGLAEDLPGNVGDLDARWGVFEGSGASWVFLDAAAIRLGLESRSDLHPARLHGMLHTRGGRHLALLTGAVWSRTDVEDLLAEEAAVYGAAATVALTDTTPPPLLLADRGVAADAVILRASALAAAVEHLDRSVVDGRPRLVLAPADDPTGEFWRRHARRLQDVRGGWSVHPDGEGPGGGRTDTVLCLPVLPGEGGEVPGPADGTVRSWREADRLRHLSLDARRRRASLELAAHLAGRWDAVELLDPRWWHGLRPRTLPAGRGWSGEQALAAAAGSSARVFDLPGAGGSAPPSAARIRAVAQWCDSRQMDLPTPSPDSVHGVRLEVGRDESTAYGLLAAVLAAREAGDLDRWILAVGDEPWQAARDVRAGAAPGVTVWTAGASLPLPGAVLWARPADLLDPGFQAFLDGHPPAAAVVPALRSWLPGEGGGHQQAAAALRVLLGRRPPAVVLQADRLPSAWSRYLVAAAQVDVVEVDVVDVGAAEPASQDGEPCAEVAAGLPPALLDQRLRRLLARLRSLLVERRRLCGPTGPAHLVSARELVGLDRLSHLTGLTPHMLRDGIRTLRWAASLAGETLSTADAESVDRPGDAGGHALLIRRRYAECEQAVAVLAEHLQLFLPLWLGDVPAGGSTWIDLSVPPASIDPADLARLDTFLLEVDPAAGLRCAAPRGVLGSPRRLLALQEEPAAVLEGLLRQLDIFRDRLRDVMGAAVETPGGFLVETGLEKLRREEKAFLGMGAALDEWRWLGPANEDALHVVDLLTLADSQTASGRGHAWSLVGDLLGTAPQDASRAAATATRRGGWRTLLQGREGAAPDRSSAARVAALVGAGDSGQGQLVLRGLAGTGRMQAVFDGLVAAERDGVDPGPVMVCCPDKATAARWNRRAMDLGLLLDVRIPGREDLPSVSPGDALAAAVRQEVVILCEAQRFVPERRYRVAQFGRGRRLLVTVDPAASTESWENLFLTTPRTDEVVATTRQELQARRLWQETAALVAGPEQVSDQNGRADRGEAVAEYAANLDQCLGRVRSALDEGLLPPYFRLTAPLSEDLDHLGAALRAQGWLAVDEESCDALMLPGPVELLTLAAALPGLAATGTARELLQRLPGAGAGAAAWSAEGASDSAELTLAEVHAVVAGIDLLPVLAQPAARRRVRTLLASWGHRTLADLEEDALWGAWWRLLNRSPGEDEAGSEDAGRPVVLLCPAERAPGNAVPGGVYLCLGSEEPRQHYRVFSGVTDRLLVLYQERSPLPGEGDSRN